MTTLILKDNRLLNKESGTALGNMLKSNTVLTKLDVSDNGYDSDDDGPGFAQELAIGIKDNGALFSVDVGKNDIPVDKLQEIDQAVRSNRLRLIREDSNKSLLEMDLSSRYLDAKDAIVVVEYIKDNGALSKLIFGGDEHFAPQLQRMVTPDPAVLEIGMTEADFSNKHLGAAGAIIISAWISHKDNGAISSINLLRNSIPVEQAQELVKIMQATEKLTTLCGLSKEETELDFSNQGLGAGDAVLIANDVSDMGAMTSLNLASNKLGFEGAKIIAACLPKCT
jgi:hypothetical protein